MTTYLKSHGGRENYYPVKYKKDLVNDCTIRAIAHGTGQDYMGVYNELFERAQKIGNLPNARKTYEPYLLELGWQKHSPAKNARGKKIRLKNWDSDGTYIILTSKHLTCVKDGVLLDSWDCRPWCGNSYFTPPHREETI